ncbi:MAG: ATP-binding cassette domain-containing protein [Cocleimonas sp.]
MTEIARPVNLRYKNIVKSYGKGKHTKLILDNVELEIKGGECTLITGKNGSGKSTLLRILGGLLAPNKAMIDTGLQTLKWNKYRKLINNQVMYLYQEPYMFDGTVRKNLSYALHKDQPKEAVDQALKWAELENRSNTQAKFLSGGERQRVALAQAWLKQPAVLLLDEPTANMDTKSRTRTEDLLSTFKETGTALYIASHDPNHFHRIMNHRLLLEEGRITQSDTDLLDSSAEYTNDNVTLLSQQKPNT